MLPEPLADSLGVALDGSLSGVLVDPLPDSLGVLSEPLGVLSDVLSESLLDWLSDESELLLSELSVLRELLGGSLQLIEPSHSQQDSISHCRSRSWLATTKASSSIGCRHQFFH